MKSRLDRSRRKFLTGVTAALPSLQLVAQGLPAKSSAGADPASHAESAKFTPLDLREYFTSTRGEFRPPNPNHRRAAGIPRDGYIDTPSGLQSLRGIPFRLGPEGRNEKAWIVLSKQKASWTAEKMEFPVAKNASAVCVAAFCDWDTDERPAPGKFLLERIGQTLADMTMVFDDGSTHPCPIRRRFEVNSPSISWGHLCFAAMPHTQDSPRKLTDSLTEGTEWGLLQWGLQDSRFPNLPRDQETPPFLWLSIYDNPRPERPIRSLRLESKSEDPLVICGVTLFHGHENPLRYERLSLYRITLPEPAAEESDRWNLSVDLGAVARSYSLPPFDGSSWLASSEKGLGGRAEPLRGGRYLYAEVTASAEATLMLTDARTGRRFEFELGRVVPGRDVEARPLGARVEILESTKTWVHGRVIDSPTGRPTPARISFRSPEGRYIPPYGHRTEVNNAWFQDYGADLKVMDVSFAYVDGTFQVELPVGEVFVELVKGFEYEPVRQKLRIEPGQRELKLELGRNADWRSKGWVTADTHVHFLSPSTAVLEGQAEGLNLINLLAAQWGDLFTNVGDLPHGPLTSRDGETVVWTGTENRQHILGHLALLGGHGEPVYPMSASGPSESYLGDPVWTSLADWADRCRQREGLAVCAHFPYPAGEVAADIVLGKIDALELYPDYGDEFDNSRFLHWYNTLNCGFRLPVVGGTDKMSAYMAVGANRTYAFLGQEEFNFASWAKAVRGGNTFMTSGPLLMFRADGRLPGEEIQLGSGGGTVEVQVEAQCFVPLHRVEVVWNGGVVASTGDASGRRTISLTEKVRVPGPGWLAARCYSKLSPTTRWGFNVLAHTSPVYVQVPGRELFSSPAAVYLMTLIEGAETWLDRFATRPDPERLARVRSIFEEAKKRLHQRMHAQGIQH